jgi:4-amino-4-deoxy-L-arabinose transferase-like glycosyltransferase
LVWFGTLLLFGFQLGRLDFWAPDEPRYGAIAEELRSFRHGPQGLALLHLNDVPYTQKPPLYFWLAALAGAPAGRVTEWAARLPSALAGFGCVVLMTWIGRRRFGHPMLALLAAGILATSFRFLFTARRAQLDVLLTSFELIAIAIFVFIEFRDRTPGAVAPGESAARPTATAIAGLHGSLGAAALVKGPVGWLPLLVFAAYLAWEGRLRAFRAIAPWWAWGLSLGPVAVWIASAIALAPAGFAEVAVTENLIGRFFSGTAHVRPAYYFLFQTPADFLPWTLLLPFGVPRVWRWARSTHTTDDPMRPSSATISAARFLLVWVAVPLVFFSLSAGKRGVYLLPVFPALALIGAIGAARLDAAGRCDPRWLSRSAMAVAAVAAIELSVVVFGLPRLEAEKSPRPIAESAARWTRPDEALGVYGLRPIEGAIAYYGDRPVASLDDAAALRAFLGGGGRAVLLRARHFEQWGSDFDLEPVARFRSGRRALVLAVGSRHEPRGNQFPRPARNAP